MNILFGEPFLPAYSCGHSPSVYARSDATLPNALNPCLGTTTD